MQLQLAQIEKLITDIAALKGPNKTPHFEAGLAYLKAAKDSLENHLDALETIAADAAQLAAKPCTTCGAPPAGPTYTQSVVSTPPTPAPAAAPSTE